MRPGTDRALARTWVVTLLMILALMANVTYVQAFQAEDLRDSALNPRRLTDRFTIDRGPIVADGERLAWSEPVDGGEEYQRHYKDGPAFAPVTGYFSVFSETGLEKAANRVLDGSDPRLATTNFVDKLIGNPVPGGTVEATVDADAQRVAFQALKESGTRRAAAVALDAETGAILVMASTPSYDPDAVSTLDREKAQQAFERLNDQPLKPLLNKATDEVYPPGSSFKTVVAAAKLEAGASKNTQVKAGAGYRAPQSGQPIGNSHGGACSRNAIPLITAFAESCNTTFAYMGAEEPGHDAVAEEASEFGFGDRIRIEDGIAAAASVFPDTDSPALSALAAIGQGSTVATPLQMAMVTAGVLNDGEIMKPYLIAELQASDGSTVGRAAPERFAHPLTSEEAAQLRDMMEAVVASGTGRSLRGTSVLGGKTGTADVAGKSYNDRWFIGYGPREDPEYAVAVVTEAPGAGSESGPIAAEIIDALAS
ncbi:peptidoglycan D,D-transpeptidase FtsI family protein [Actinomadura algeriensis]|uniref:Peptidoglycan glycosyltransferase n=1 Tax=Actinomadura algeriensis TaxID=1679523 RepID=A0ABR9JWH2_9ACTN|nr:penicillin-binding transpeptidase domain-containing protein [Actinomadura algeriensis]MBE1534749.1 peptidoglycan glycosyltransferase [Actinomadura algeriensis]